jgi:hypothetical protein
MHGHEIKPRPIIECMKLTKGYCMYQMCIIYILVVARYERRLECRLWVRGKHVISNLVTVVQRVTMATSFPLASISSFQLRAPWLIANASRRPLSLLITLHSLFSSAHWFNPSLLHATAAATISANALASRITQVRLLTDLSSSVAGLLHGVFPPTHRSIVRTPSFGIQVHWPGRCFAPSPALLCYHALPHILLRIYFSFTVASSTSQSTKSSRRCQ